MVRSCQSKIKLNPSAQSKVSGHVLEMLILVKIPNLEFVYFSVANTLNYIPLYLYDIPKCSSILSGLEGTMQGSSKDLYWF